MTSNCEYYNPSYTTEWQDDAPTQPQQRLVVSPPTSLMARSSRDPNQSCFGHTPVRATYEWSDRRSAKSRTIVRS
jgi:hypothetical protein